MPLISLNLSRVLKRCHHVKYMFKCLMSWFLCVLAGKIAGLLQSITVDFHVNTLVICNRGDLFSTGLISKRGMGEPYQLSIWGTSSSHLWCWVRGAIYRRLSANHQMPSQRHVESSPGLCGYVEFNSSVPVRCDGNCYSILFKLISAVDILHFLWNWPEVGSTESHWW